MRRFAGGLLGCVGLLLAISGCVEPPASTDQGGGALVGEPCDSSSECSGTLRCLSGALRAGGVCVQPCATGAECGTGVCTPIGGSNTGYCDPGNGGFVNEPDGLPDNEPEASPDTPIGEPEASPEATPEANPEPTPEANPDAEPPRPDLAMGPLDNAASRSCDLFDTTSDRVLAVTNRGDAGQVLILPSDAKSYMVQLPEGEGFLTIEIPDWEAEIAFFAHYTTDFQVFDGDPLGGKRWNGACGQQLGVTDTRLKFHSWGAFTIRYGAEGPREAWFSAIHLNP